VRTPKTALLIDAGYLIAAGGLLCCNSWRREDIACDYAGLLAALRDDLSARAGDSLFLRAYWYDAAIDGRPTFEQARIGRLPYVKLRLGRLSKDGTQKGVDGMIYGDLLVLAQRGAVDRVFLISGDDDICEGVREAQRYGVLVELLTIPGTTSQHNVSAHLAAEVDQLTVLPKRFWSAYLSPRDGRADPPDDELVADTRAQGAAFARHLAETGRASEVEALLRRFPHLPHEVDVMLLAWAERSLGSLRRRPDLKRELRAHFWFELKDGASLERSMAAVDDSPLPETGDSSAAPRQVGERP
jgi:uncharacterized LabA/DUF88 family protein